MDIALRLCHARHLFCFCGQKLGFGLRKGVIRESGRHARKAVERKVGVNKKENLKLFLREKLLPNILAKWLPWTPPPPSLKKRRISYDLISQSNPPPDKRGNAYD